jgi:hypothetical protein
MDVRSGGEAWSAVGALGAAGIAIVALVIAWISVGITAASAIAVWRLGTEANAASKEATRIAGVGASRQEHRDETEELFVLMQINGEVSFGKSRLEVVLKNLNAGGPGAEHFKRDKAHREKIFQELEKISFPMTAAAKDRIHYLDRKVGGSLLRAYGLLELTKEGCQSRTEQDSEEDFESAHRGLVFIVPLLLGELGVVSAACESGVRRLGLADAKVARAAALWNA